MHNASTSENRGMASVVAALVMLFGASRVLYQLKAALNQVWDVPTPKERSWRRFVWNRFVALLMVIAVAIFVLATALGMSLASGLIQLVTKIPFGWQALSLVATVVAMALITGSILKWVPDCEVSWREAAAGGLVGGLLFSMGQFALTIYLAHNNIAAGFGPAGTLVIILIWIYFWTNVLLFAAAFARAYGQHSSPQERTAAAAG